MFKEIQPEDSNEDVEQVNGSEDWQSEMYEGEGDGTRDHEETKLSCEAKLEEEVARLTDKNTELSMEVHE